MKKDSNIRGIILRYISILLITLFFYFSSIPEKVLTVLTLYPLNFILNLFTDTLIFENSLVISNFIIDIIPACVAVSAYLLLFILNFITPMTSKTRLKSILFSLLALWLLNLLRILFLAYLFMVHYSNFEFIHKFIWYFASTMLVVLIWLATCYLFKIKSIPVYSDIIYLLDSKEKVKSIRKKR